MSLINDALKRARHNHTPRDPQNPLPPLPPAKESTPVGVWLAPAIVIFLIVAAIFSIAWAVAHHSVQTIVSAPPDPVIVTQQAAEAVLPIVPPPPSEPLNPMDAPQLQGIFYSPTAPTAIVDGKTVSVGSHYLQYRVTEITKSTVTLAGPDGKAIKLGMSN